ncbi:hypothetical protein F4810DRAFT_607803 [Camillea tinctor]|nr:hypothetical protein F4810DRAFT_607803 [Camillea tinctor]
MNSRYSDRIGHSRPEDECSSVFGIALVKRSDKETRSLSESYLDDIALDRPFTPEMVVRERARRDQILDRISQLPTREKNNRDNISGNISEDNIKRISNRLLVIS